MGCKLLFVGENVGRISAAPEREDVRVFEQQQLFVPTAGAQALDGALLQAQAVGVGRSPQPAGFATSAHMGNLRSHSASSQQPGVKRQKAQTSESALTASFRVS